MAFRSSTSAPWNSFTNRAHVVWRELTSRMPSLTSALSMMSRICFVMSTTWVRFSLSIVNVCRTTFKVCTVTPSMVLGCQTPSDPISCTRYPWCRGGESNPHGPRGPADFKSAASPSSATPATAFHDCMEAASGFEPLNRGFADLRLNHLATPPQPLNGGSLTPLPSTNGAGNGIRTRDPNLGKVVLYH